ncbi:MAG TPA: two-component sensor histidine kinase, partial [Rhodobacteraceae bacterium]|nr:two-component sensor histidine kinase [Paracoccaceae bacterium]
QAVSNAHRAGKAVELGKVSGEGKMMLRPKVVLRAVENLIGNAVRYGSRAVVSVVMSDRTLVISVEDDGPGIAAKDRDEALKPFSRLEPARNQNKGSGVGLGLSIALDVARAHGGSLRLGQSETLGGLKVDLVLAR